jgi:hypothetical protein
LERYSNIFSFYPNGEISGFSTSSILKIAKVLGYSQQSILLLLPYAEQGLMEAIKDKG